MQFEHKNSEYSVKDNPFKDSKIIDLDVSLDLSNDEKVLAKSR